MGLEGPRTKAFPCRDSHISSEQHVWYDDNRLIFSSVFLLIKVKDRVGEINLLHNVMNAFVGTPARSVGWRDPGFIHTSFLKDLWPNVE